MEQQMNQKIIELQNENEKLKEDNKEIVELKDKNVKLEVKIHELKEKLAKIEAYMKKKKYSIPHRIMPAELLNELFASMPLENAFSLLAKMPNGLLARNVQKMINGIKEEMKNNKLNSANCGRKLSISADGLEAKYSSPDEGYNCARTILPFPSFNFKAINKPFIAFYFEIEILNGYDVVIGFCDLQFQMEGEDLGVENNSIGISNKQFLWIDNDFIQFGNVYENFDKGDFVGLGIIHHPNSKMKCFLTWNGKLLAKGALPSKFANMELFPAISLHDADELIRMNFGKEEWQFKEFGKLL